MVGRVCLTSREGNKLSSVPEYLSSFLSELERAREGGVGTRLGWFLTSKGSQEYLLIERNIDCVLCGYVCVWHMYVCVCVYAYMCV